MYLNRNIRMTIGFVQSGRHIIIMIALALGLLTSFVALSGVSAQIAPMPGQTLVVPGKAGVQAAELSNSTQQNKVTLIAVDSPLSYVLTELSRQAKRPIVFNAASPEVNRRVTVRASNSELLAALGIALRGTELKATVAPDKETIVVGPVDTLTDSIRKSVSGKGIIAGIVRDSHTGQPIRGVTVSVSGTPVSVVTGEDGKFIIRSLSAGNHSISIRFFGYRSILKQVIVEANNAVPLIVSLSPIASALSGVVTTATGLQSKLEINTDVTRISVDSIMAIAPVRSVTDILTSRVPGLHVTHTSGTPGDPSRLRLRGVSSINGSNAPIVIVDGVRMDSPDGSQNEARPSMLGLNTNLGDVSYPAPSPLDQLDVNTIETIEVMKGPTASSLYGSDAANGVIVITTKRGRPGQTRLTIALNSGLSFIPGKFKENVYIFGHRINEPTMFCRFDYRCIVDSVVHFQALNHDRLSPLGTGNSSGVSGSISGGVDAVQYSFTGSTSNQLGIVKLPAYTADLYRSLMNESPPRWMKRPDRFTTYNMSNSISISPGLKFNATMNNMVAFSRQQRTSLGMTAAGQLMNVYLDPDNSANNIGGELAGYQERSTVSQLNTQHNLTLNWNYWSSFPLVLRAGVNPSRSNSSTFLPSGLPLALIYSSGSHDSSGKYSGAVSSQMMSTLAINTTVPVQVRDGARLQFAVGADFNRQQRASQMVATTNLPLGVTTPTSFPKEFTLNSASQASTSTYGIFLEPRLSIKSRLFVQSGLRFDGGSASGDRAGLSRYPKLGASFIVLDELSGDMQSDGIFTSIVQQLKVRSAFGQAGVQPGPIQHMRLFAAHSNFLMNDGTPQPGYLMQSLGNTKLLPERAMEFELGVDAEILQQRASISATWYRKHQKNAIMLAAVAASVGARGGGVVVPSNSLDGNEYRVPFSALGQYVNIGNVLNSGFEFQLNNARLFESAPFTWNANVMLSRRNNKLTKRSEGADAFHYSTATRLVEGYPLFGYWAHPLVGYADLNNDGIVQANELAYSDSSSYRGSPEPQYSSSMGTTFGFLNSRLSVSLFMSYQHKMSQLNYHGLGALETSASLPDATLYDQAVALFSGERLVQVSSGGMISSPYYLIQTVSVYRLESVSLNYVVPQSLARSMRMSQVRVAIQGSNLGIKTGYTGLDPNVNAYSTGNLTADKGQLPQPREWRLNINLSR